MLLGLSQDQMKEWGQSLHAYQKAKRTKRPFGSSAPPVQKNIAPIVLEKQMRFNPVLQSFRDQREQEKTIQREEMDRVNKHIKHLQHNYKYAPDYDIINLSRSEVLPQELRSSPVLDPRKKEYHDPSYQDYNIINGKAYQPDYLKQVGYKRINQHPRNLKPEQPRSFNIVNCSYEDSTKKEQEPTPHSFNRSQLLRVQDSINGRYANPEQEKQEHKEYKSVPRKLPPSYLNRESYVQGQQKEVSEVVKHLDEQKQKAKQRYKMRYIVDDEYHQRNEYLTQKQQRESIRRILNGRSMQMRGRQFSTIESQRGM